MWHRSYIKKILEETSVIGTFHPHRVDRVAGKKVRVPMQPVEGYFPAVIERDAFDRVAALSSGRTGTTKHGISNILGGLAKCPRCGATMTRVNKGSRRKAGKPYLVCTVAKAGAGCEYEASRCDQIEQAILDFAPTFYAEIPSADDALQEEWMAALRVEEGIETEIDRIVDAIREVGHSPALLGELRKLELLRDEARKTTIDAENRASAVTTNRTNNTLGKLIDAMSVEPRDIAAVNVMLRQLFDKVVVDRPSGHLWLHWKHAPGHSMGIVYAWPEERP